MLLKAGQMKSVTILGASGSIGTNALAFLRQHPTDFTLGAASFARSWEAAVAIYREFKPEVVAFTEETAAKAFHDAVGGQCHVVSGPKASAEIAAMPTDVVLASICRRRVNDGRRRRLKNPQFCARPQGRRR